MEKKEIKMKTISVLGIETTLSIADTKLNGKTICNNSTRFWMF